VLFNITGGYNAYGDGRRSTWFAVGNITYTMNEVPEPMTAPSSRLASPA
jgi:hypothetical protein